MLHEPFSRDYTWCSTHRTYAQHSRGPHDTNTQRTEHPSAHQQGPGYTSDDSGDGPARRPPSHRRRRVHASHQTAPSLTTLFDFFPPIPTRQQSHTTEQHNTCGTDHTHSETSHTTIVAPPGHHPSTVSHPPLTVTAHARDKTSHKNHGSATLSSTHCITPTPQLLKPNRSGTTDTFTPLSTTTGPTSPTTAKVNQLEAKPPQQDSTVPFTNLLTNTWAAYDNTGQIAASLREDPLREDLLHQLHTTIMTSPDPTAWPTLFNTVNDSSNYIHVTSFNCDTDYAATPGRGFCSVAAAHQILRSTAPGKYNPVHLSSEEDTTALLSLVQRLLALCLTAGITATRIQTLRRTLTRMRNSLRSPNSQARALPAKHYMDTEDFLLMLKLLRLRFQFWQGHPLYLQRGWVLLKTSTGTTRHPPTPVHNVAYSASHYFLLRITDVDSKCTNASRAARLSLLQLLQSAQTSSHLFTCPHPVSHTTTSYQPHGTTTPSHNNMDTLHTPAYAAAQDHNTSCIDIYTSPPPPCTTSSPTPLYITDGMVTLSITPRGLREIEAQTLHPDQPQPPRTAIQNAGRIFRLHVSAQNIHTAHDIPANGYCAYGTLHRLHMLVTSKRPTATYWELDFRRPEHRTYAGQWLSNLLRDVLLHPSCDQTTIVKLQHALTAMTSRHQHTYTTPDDIRHWLSVREMHWLATFFTPTTTWATDGESISIVGIPSDPHAYGPAWTSDELREAILLNLPHIVLHNAHFYIINPAGLAINLDNALLNLEPHIQVREPSVQRDVPPINARPQHPTSPVATPTCPPAPSETTVADTIPSSDTINSSPHNSTSRPRKTPRTKGNRTPTLPTRTQPPRKARHAQSYADLPDTVPTHTLYCPHVPFRTLLQAANPPQPLTWDPTLKYKVLMGLADTLPKGNALYAGEQIPAHAIISECTGQRLSILEARSTERSSDYLVQDTQGTFVIDARDRKSKRILCAAGYINDPLQANAANVEFYTKTGRIYIRALRKINPHEELLVNYGYQYWEDQKWSTEILLQARAAYAEDIALREQEWHTLLSQKQSPPRQTLTLPEPSPSPLTHATHFKFSTWNVNGNPSSNPGKIEAILHYFRSQSLDCLYLLDVRLSQRQAAYLDDYIQDQIPGVLVCRFLNTKPKLGPTDPHMGGALAVISETWKGRIRYTNSDCTGLGLISRIEFHTGRPDIDDRLTIIGAYLPPKPATAGPCTLWTSLRAFGRATPKNGASRPYSILTNILTKWIVKARANGHTVLVGGDFNASLEGHAGKRDLRGIATSLQLTAPLIQTLNTEDPYFTFFRKDRGISRIDHILHTPLPTYIQISGNGCYTSDALTAATFDHRPVWTDFCISGTGPPLPKEQHLQIPPRLNINPADQEMVEEYQQHLSTHHQSLPEPSAHPHPADRAATKLALIHRITIDAAHDTRSADRTKKTRIHHLCQRKRSRFKDGFSAEMRVIQTALHLVIYLKRKFFNRAGYLHPHVDDTRLYSLTRRGLQRWEVTIAALDHASEDPSHPPTTIIKPAVDPRQMLTWTVATINSTHFDTLRDNLTRMLQGRARTEMRKRMTHRTHTIQAHLELQHIGKVLQTIGLKRKQTPPLTRLTLEDGATLTLPIDIQDELNKHFTAHHSIPSGLDPVAHKLHHDDTWWHELAAGADMNTPLHPHSAIPDHHQLGLRNLCKTKVTSATAKKIQDALRQQITISEFHSTLDGMAKDKAPGPSMVTTNMIKKWTPEIKIEVLGLLQTLWTHRHVPRWWRDRVMTPLLKKPEDTRL